MYRTLINTLRGNWQLATGNWQLVTGLLKKSGDRLPSFRAVRLRLKVERALNQDRQTAMRVPHSEKEKRRQERKKNT